MASNNVTRNEIWRLKESLILLYDSRKPVVQAIEMSSLDSLCRL
jgi:hypothetical protein